MSHHHAQSEKHEPSASAHGSQDGLKEAAWEAYNQSGKAKHKAHLPGDNLPKARPHVVVQEFDLLYWIEQISRTKESHAHEDVSMAPAAVKPNQYLAKERGPP
ncbi:hypothetical protein [Bremerella alba]|uniref:Uncharacterized protein n=1 Tax=Bremerella alba TaxID=980252 RepID=A0A7V9A6P1_9BACT|nr:hypothetical protein [Bremerella alba]MBA2114517.1 hypothetical protein [Bremerella alba]